jgi:hypothetical protein
MLYFEFEGRRLNAEVTWPKGDDGTITVLVTDARIARELPTDLFFDMNDGNRISYTIESPDNRRLTELQRVISRRLEDIVG